MEFELSSDQKMIDESLRGFLADQLSLDEIRRIAGQRTGFDDALWGGLSELGTPGLLVPESFGGAGLNVFDAALLAEAFGYNVAPTPFIAAGVMAPIALSMSADEAQRAEWLPKIASGEMRIAVAIGALSGTTGATQLSLDGNALSGATTGVLDCSHATHLLVYMTDWCVALTEIDASGVEVEMRPTVDRTRPLADVSFSATPVTTLTQANDPLEAALRVRDVGRLMLAADTLGAAQRMIEKAVEYAGERVQFERVIASFQAVKHMCAEMSATLEPCRSLIWYAAHAQDEIDDERRLLANLAKAQLNDVGRDIARTATEVHGGMGFTDLMGLHFWFKRISFNRQVLGGSDTCRKDVATLQGWCAA